MDEDIEIINAQTRNEKIKNFFKNYKIYLITFLLLIILILLTKKMILNKLYNF